MRDASPSPRMIFLRKVDANTMKRYSDLIRVLAALLALLLLGSCGAQQQAPVSTPEIIEAEENTEITVETPEPEASDLAGDNVVKVTTVDEFLAAIAPHTTIELAAGVYDLSTASNYGMSTRNHNYRWNPDQSYEGDGYELEIMGVEDLVIRGAGREETTIAAVPRYVNVIRFTNCADLSVEALTAGHTREQGICSGGVLYLENCRQIRVDGCGLYGCGTLGVWAYTSEDLSVTDSHIYECSSGAVEVTGCRNVTVDGCEIYRVGKTQSWPGYALFAAHQCGGFRVTNCRIYDNNSDFLLLSDHVSNCFFLSNLLENNQLSHAFEAFRFSPMVAGCLFADQSKIDSWYAGDGILAVDRDGMNLDDAALAAMRYERIDPASVSFPDSLTGEADPTEVPAGGTIIVTTPDEFLAAIGPDRTILLDGTDFALTKAENYGGIGTKYYYWSEVYDGKELVINGVSGLTIKAAADSPANTLLSVEPRYANVLRFIGCSDLHLEGFTAGHTRGQGECSGGVLYFEDCQDVYVSFCRLYGCGILGIWSNGGSGLTVDNCEIYECSYGGVWVDSTSNVSFSNCDIHDVPSPALSFYNSYGVIWNDWTYYDGSWDPDGSDGLAAYSYEELNQDTAVQEDPVPETVSIIYQNRSVEELILKQGDSVILQATGYFPNGDDSRAKYSWICEDPGVLSAQATRNGSQCVVKVLGEAPDGVLLTLDCQGVQTQVRIYCVGK